MVVNRSFKNNTIDVGLITLRKIQCIIHTIGAYITTADFENLAHTRKMQYCSIGTGRLRSRVIV